MAEDSVDKLVVFLAKRDGIDKLVKTFQYVSKLAHWQLQKKYPSMAGRAKNWEVSSGLGRKAFRTGRFLTGFNALRRNPGPNWKLQTLAVLANGGEMVYFFFDHLLWLSRIGVLDTHLATKMSFISAFGESFGYIFFIIADLINFREGIRLEKELKREIEEMSCVSESAVVEEKRKKIGQIRGQRMMQFMAISANVADLFIAIADVEPNPFCNHTLTLGVSGLVSAWAGWYRNWPS
uniref:TSA: Wollemia nobilis Ref_Wollemi_Transcript_23223_880 transcribed RNA sequence n=1 Tax=Wollemia nobilis TaxID=56998 RepID=A0A0C9RH23_9CONI